MRTTEPAPAGPALRGQNLLAALGLALLVSVGVAANAGAEQPPDGGDDQQQACRVVYDNADRLRSEYLQEALADPLSPRLDEISAEGRGLRQDWTDLGCEERFGGIGFMQRGPFQTIAPGPEAEPFTTTDLLLAPGEELIAVPEPELQPEDFTTLQLILPAGEEPLINPAPAPEPDNRSTLELILPPGEELIVVPDAEPAPDDFTNLQLVLPAGEELIVVQPEDEQP